MDIIGTATGGWENGKELTYDATENAGLQRLKWQWVNLNSASIPVGTPVLVSGEH